MTGRCRCGAPRRPLVDRRREPGHVSAGDRLQEGVEHGGGKPLVLAELGLDLAGERHVGAGQRRPQRLTHAPLVRRIEEREEKADGHALCPALFHIGYGSRHVGIAERPDDLAGWADAFGDLEAVLARYERLGVVRLQVVDLGPRLATDLQQVLKPAVVTSATLPPRRWIKALVATVVPWARKARPPLG